MWKRRSGVSRSTIDLLAIESDASVETPRNDLRASASTSNLRQDDFGRGKRGAKVLLRTRQSIADIFNRRQPSQTRQDDTIDLVEDNGESDDHASMVTVRGGASSVQSTPRAMIRFSDGAISPLDLNETGSSHCQTPSPVEGIRSVRFEDLEAGCQQDTTHSIRQRNAVASLPTERNTISTAQGIEAQQSPPLNRRTSRWKLFHRRESNLDMRQDSTTQNVERTASDKASKRSSLLNLHGAWDRWGPIRWQQRPSVVEDDETNLVSPTTGIDEEDCATTTQDFLREYSHCMDPFGCVADIAALTQWMLADSDVDAHSITGRTQCLLSTEPCRCPDADSSHSKDGDDDKTYSDAGSTSKWSIETTVHALRCLRAASDPHGFNADDDRDVDDYGSA